MEGRFPGDAGHVMRGGGCQRGGGSQSPTRVCAVLTRCEVARRWEGVGRRCRGRPCGWADSGARFVIAAVECHQPQAQQRQSDRSEAVPAQVP